VCPVIAAIAAIITGSKSKSAIRRSGGTTTGSGMATAGQVLGIANIVLSIGVGVLIAVGVSFFSHHKSYTALNQGDCFNKGTSGSALSNLVTTVSCNKSHEREVVGTFEYAAADKSQVWPGPDGFQTAAGERCTTLARDYLGQPVSGLRAGYIYPNKQSWDSGTHKVVCVVYNADGTKRIGSVRAGLGPSTNG
jgi:hypothetical protein